MAKEMKGTGSNPLDMANFLSGEVNKSLKDGSFLDKVSPITQDLLKYWFDESFSDLRDFNFHKGQKQAILNIIYLHEVLGIENVLGLYLNTNPEILQRMDVDDLSKEKYQHPMYAVKMATGTGKTWVLNAILIWQYLNARFESLNIEYGGEKSGKFSKNFLIVAPGLIVYNRLLDAFIGKEDEQGNRDFETSDFYKFKELFIPNYYTDVILTFIQNSVVKKEEISSKVTGDGLIAITNWHLLAGVEEEVVIDNPLEYPTEVLSNALPISPGTSGGNSLESLDNNFLKGNELEYLAQLTDLVVFNDEAHHIHEVKKGEEIFEVEWQRSLNFISKDKKNRFIQIDFSATPFSNTSGKNKIKHYFPHIIVDFDLKAAVVNGLVKMIAIDKRKEIDSIDLDFKAIRDGRKVIGLSEGQRLMLRAGLKKLQILDSEFTKLDKNKHPKMLIMCEDTQVAPFVSEFLYNEGLSDDDVMEIHSNRKGEVTEKQWNEIKQRLFNIDNYEKPKVIVSVLMLREGFDVNNISVIVPLRSSDATILLEQTIGRGLRLMWREPEYVETKAEDRKKVLIDKKEPSNYLDLLSIIEHPKYMDFYNKFLEEGIVIDVTDTPKSGNTLGDMITVGLRENYRNFDFYWPIINREREEILSKEELSLDNLEPFDIPLSSLQKIKGEGGEKFESHDIIVRTRFGEYNVTADLFSSESYNEFISKIINSITSQIQSFKQGQKSFPVMQINNAEIAGLIDNYIRYKLFNTNFNPLENENWRILLMSANSITNHIIKEISKKIYQLQTNVNVREAEVKKIFFSQVDTLRMRKNYSLEISKSIYNRLPYPSNKGGLEKLFIENVDLDGRVDSFVKINEYYHTFATITYIREDGLLARYFPDFIIKVSNDIYIVETKSDHMMSSFNVQSKRIATLDFIEKINQLKGENRMDSKWHYVLLGETTFRGMLNKNASIKEILDYSVLTESKVKGNLDDYL
ncbi:type I restriction enzyme EcoKI subunit R [Methanobrevibacter cuticularis]|uniref:Type I restriction enzyme EcoKI subunit R n=1 Tax=Methanobrevibacter cuticularis TaxID=47311 RepID=A0A166E127_9EURY|nr:DEAD/DEAH box helicase family protein [Methanobrevibacter cuticularis]KZX16161.1 type I restriction enzyme EcoKI subunit R [Methanobrevibacter cuticularis]